MIAFYTFEIGPREKRERMQIGMFVKLIFAEPEIKNGKQPSERAWVKITSVASATAGGTTAITYVGEVIDSMMLDIDVGTRVPFGPEHICEWDVPPQKPRTRKR